MLWRRLRPRFPMRKSRPAPKLRRLLHQLRFLRPISCFADAACLWPGLSRWGAAQTGRGLQKRRIVRQQARLPPQRLELRQKQRRLVRSALRQERMQRPHHLLQRHSLQRQLSLRSPHSSPAKRSRRACRSLAPHRQKRRAPRAKEGESHARRPSKLRSGLGLKSKPGSEPEPKPGSKQHPVPEPKPVSSQTRNAFATSRLPGNRRNLWHRNNLGHAALQAIALGGAVGARVIVVASVCAIGHAKQSFCAFELRF